MTKHFQKNFMVFISIIAITFFSACKKNKEIFNVQDLSVSTESRFNKIQYAWGRWWICGGVFFDKSVIYTSQDGEHFLEIDLPRNFNQKELFAMDIRDSIIVCAGVDATILHSSDHGKSWNAKVNGTWVNIYDIAFQNNDNLYAIGYGNFSNGYYQIMDAVGNSSPSNVLHQNFALNQVKFINDNVGYMCGYGIVLKTTDGENHWNTLDISNDNFKGMCWKNESEGVVVGYEGSIYHTANGGESWFKAQSGNNPLKKQKHYLSIAHNQENVCIAVGEKGLVSISFDMGLHWQQVDAFTNKDLRSIIFTEENICYICGDKGAIFRILL